MAGDFSRSSLNPVKQYSGVLMQQGRVLVDADWNEQLALQQYRSAAEIEDIIGRCGTNKSGNGFLISQLRGQNDLRIDAGRYWVDGLLCELAPESIPVAAPAANPTGAQVNVPSLSVDDRDLAVGDWVEISGHGHPSLTAQVTAVAGQAVLADPNAISPSTFAITLSQQLGALGNADMLWLRRVTTFTTQPFLLSQWDSVMEVSPANGVGESLSLTDGDYLVVLEAWQREVNALQDPHIREVALGGPDTCERLQTVWQVHLIPYHGEASPPSSPLASPPAKPVDCCSPFPGLDEFQSALTTTGLMNAQVGQALQSPPQCLPIAPSGYQGVANQLYRVEVFQSGQANGSATIVWSRDNAMVETSIVCIDSTNHVYVTDLGKDDLHSFSLNDYVEIVDPDGELEGQPRFLAQINQVPISSVTPSCSATSAPAYQIVLQPAPPASLQGKSNLRLRRWDMPQTQTMLLDAYGNPQGIQITPGWIQIENNIEVNFSDGYYASTSYWQIPARTATGDIEWPPFAVPNSNPIPQPPLGIAHSFCRLALVHVAKGAWKIDDCRCTFPSLTSICAGDVCYHGSGCELESVNTVEQALDELSAKMRYHNKMLHGTGTVCGLAVSCCANANSPTSVCVAPGYAIDCEGYDLIVDTTASVDLAQLLPLSPQQTELADGDYELILSRAELALEVAARDAAPVEVLASPDTKPCCSKASSRTKSNSCIAFSAIPCKPQSFVDQLLDGGLWMDFYTKCLKPWYDGFQSDYTGEYLSSAKLISKSQALTSSLTNLVVQYIQPSLTKDVFISKVEDAYLRDFYDWVAGRLNDSTFCALAANLTPYPDYSKVEANSRMGTIFGKGLKTRLRVSPDGKFACAMGVNADIQVFNLQTRELAAVVPMPIAGDATGWVVQDVAISTEDEIFAIATAPNNTDSLFARGTRTGAGIAWTANHSLGALPFVTLALADRNTQPVVFAAVRAQGIFQIDAYGTSPITVTQFAQFACFGHLVSWGDYLFATASSGTAATSGFDEVLCYRTAPANESPYARYPLAPATGDLTDDLVVSFGDGTVPVQFVVSALNPTTSNKELLWFNNVLQGAGKGTEPPSKTVDLGENTTIRLARAPLPTTNKDVIVSLEDSCRLAKLTVAGEILTLSRYAPVEVHPTSLAFADNAPNLYVLNSTSNTISTIPADMAEFTDYADLETYRQSANQAFADLAMAVLQNLKDCFCNLLLPACPTCDDESEEGRGVALACITVKNGSVEKICNLEKRQIVKTFPTMGYWLSLLPVVPLVKILFEKLCCFVFPKLNNPPAPPQTDAGAVTGMFVGTTGESMRAAYTKVSGYSYTDFATMAKQQATPVGQFAVDAFNAAIKPNTAVAQAQIKQVNGMSLADAQAALAQANVKVAYTQAYDPNALVNNFSAYSTAPASVPPNSSVTLVVDSNQQVRYYIPTPPVVDTLSATVATNQADVQAQLGTVTATDAQLQTRLTADEQLQAPALTDVKALQGLVSTLQTQITTMQTTQAQELAVRDQQIATLNTTTQEMQTKLTTMDALSAQVKLLTERIPPPAVQG
jgi:hypothetical protein